MEILESKRNKNGLYVNDLTKTMDKCMIHQNAINFIDIDNKIDDNTYLIKCSNKNTGKIVLDENTGLISDIKLYRDTKDLFHTKVLFAIRKYIGYGIAFKIGD